MAASLSAWADDSAAAIAAGGLVPRRETRIVMAKEVLRIGMKKIVVDYDFRNDSDQDVTTEVAFPVPPYESGFADGPAPEEQSFQSFKLWVNGKPVHCEPEAKATLNGKDVTAVLNANRIDIPTFGHFTDTVDSKHQEVIDSPDFFRLPKDTRDQLVKAGLFELVEAPWGKWTVHLQYHWTQTFPARAIVHIQHEYFPVVGYHYIDLDSIKLALQSAAAQKAAAVNPEIRYFFADLMGYCPDAQFLRGVARQVEAIDEKTQSIMPGQYWVDFILTSANTWKQPIEDFTLIVERPQLEQGMKTLLSFCSPANGKVEKLDAGHFQVHLTDFIPASELHIGFFQVPVSNTAPAAKRK
ncbi:MAG: DUF4424 family protein [Terracidiphilus sp.]